MNRLLRPLAVLPLISLAACASFPGLATVAPPDQPPPAASLPPPAICLTEPEAPQTIPVPALPAEAPAPSQPPQLSSVLWLRGALEHFQSRTVRAEIVQGYAANVADEERRVRETNATAQVGCADRLRARDTQ